MMAINNNQLYEPDYVAIGKRVREARKNLKLSQEQVCERAELSPSHMSHIESGKTKVSLPTLIMIANILNTTVDSLLYDNLSVSIAAYDKDFKELVSDCSALEGEVIFTAAAEVKKALKVRTLK